MKPKEENPKQLMDKQLKLMRLTIDSLESTSPYYKKLLSAEKELKTIIDQHFSLSLADQRQKHTELEKKLHNVCSKYKEAIESNAKIKATFYGFLTQVTRILNLIGVSLSAQYGQKCRFFKEASHTSQAPLSNFSQSLELQRSEDNENEKNGRSLKGVK